MAINNVLSASRLVYAVIVPEFIYIIIMIGITISFAGKPRMNASSITPSSPKKLPRGSKKSEQSLIIVVPLTVVFDINHISIPAGMDTTTALDSTNNVLSKTERTIIFPNCGFLNGGSSNVNEDGVPFNRVLDKMLEAINVAIIAKVIRNTKMKVDKADAPNPPANPAKNIVITAIKAGNLPLHGIKLFVMIAMSCSLGELIILHPVTPAALQPNPIHMVSACFPQVFALQK